MKIKQINNEDTIELWGNITDIMVDLMGSFVKSAFILLVIKYSGDNIEDLRPYAKSGGEELENYYLKYKYLIYNGNKIKITFKNGKTILLNSSDGITISANNKI